MLSYQIKRNNPKQSRSLAVVVSPQAGITHILSSGISTTLSSRQK